MFNKSNEAISVAKRMDVLIGGSEKDAETRITLDETKRLHIGVFNGATYITIETYK